ncbi:ArpU family phage packaging/lysis transcriptional regulator [Paenibacillus alginolyticus]|uniref:ArpU family transcriptional regulator n=1 Tax=Paenibacillus alginolyticus TaxID=59839 RepID=A0ABT4GHS5_9BACL|nr:ArpU family phage packaging/lysis transcriptional regulator [Paenibacillus alginolyticus]MCY9695604.1 ArpU family transcriptional regulator [Paenibacillus alginolyticus]MEC0148260.1 ArpU family phage packaging/lysis transcriptional regulator [Paenibacillus alginolyticus]
MVGRILHIEQEQIDRRATRKRVEDVLETVRMYRLMGALRRESGAILEMKMNGIEMGSPTVHNTESEDMMIRLNSECEHALSILEVDEQEIIRKRYLQKDKQFDFMLFHELNMSERTYRRVKAKAIAKLAYMLRLEVSQ